LKNGYTTFYDADISARKFSVLFRQPNISSEFSTKDNTFRISDRYYKSAVYVGVDTG
jgi:hypothetical protein